MVKRHEVFTVSQMEAIIRGLYLGLLGRGADESGLEHWLSLWRKGVTVQAIAADIIKSAEYHQRSARSIDPVQLYGRAIKEARALLRQTPLTIVDVGAQNLANEEHAYAPLVRDGLPHRIIGFEPLENRREERLADSQDASPVTLLPAFIGDGREHVFHINRPDATSSLLPFNRDIIGRFVDLDGLQTAYTEPVSTITLDDALNNESDIAFLKFDIQGFELSALRHAQKTLERTLVVHCEVSFMEIYKDQPLFSEIEQHMRGAGFDLMDLRSLCRYPFANTPFGSSRDWLGWADAVFFRRFDESTSWRDRVAQSLIALVVYDKPSLAAWLVRDLNNTPAETYSRILNALEIH